MKRTAKLEEFRWNLQFILAENFQNGLKLGKITRIYQKYTGKRVRPSNFLADGHSWKEVLEKAFGEDFSKYFKFIQPSEEEEDCGGLKPTNENNYIIAPVRRAIPELKDIFERTKFTTIFGHPPQIEQTPSINSDSSSSSEKPPQKQYYTLQRGSKSDMDVDSSSSDEFQPVMKKVRRNCLEKLYDDITSGEEDHLEAQKESSNTSGLEDVSMDELESGKESDCGSKNKKKVQDSEEEDGGGDSGASSGGEGEGGVVYESSNKEETEEEEAMTSESSTDDEDIAQKKERICTRSAKLARRKKREEQRKMVGSSSSSESSDSPPEHDVESEGSEEEDSFIVEEGDEKEEEERRKKKRHSSAELNLKQEMEMSPVLARICSSKFALMPHRPMDDVTFEEILDKPDDWVFFPIHDTPDLPTFFFQRSDKKKLLAYVFLGGDRDVAANYGWREYSTPKTHANLRQNTCVYGQFAPKVYTDYANKDKEVFHIFDGIILENDYIYQQDFKDRYDDCKSFCLDENEKAVYKDLKMRKCYHPRDIFTELLDTGYFFYEEKDGCPTLRFAEMDLSIPFSGFLFMRANSKFRRDNERYIWGSDKTIKCLKRNRWPKGDVEAQDFKDKIQALRSEFPTIDSSDSD